MKLLLREKDIERVIELIVEKTVSNESEQVKQLKEQIKTMESEHKQKVDEIVKQYEDLETTVEENINVLKAEKETQDKVIKNLEIELKDYDDFKIRYDSLYRDYCRILDAKYELERKYDIYKDSICDIKSVIEDAEIEEDEIDMEE